MFFSVLHCKRENDMFNDEITRNNDFVTIRNVFK